MHAPHRLIYRYIITTEEAITVQLKESVVGTAGGLPAWAKSFGAVVSGNLPIWLKQKASCAFGHISSQYVLMFRGVTR